MTTNLIVKNTRNPSVGQPVRILNKDSKHKGLKAEITAIKLGVTSHLPISVTVKVYKTVKKTCSVTFKLANSLEIAE